MGICIVAYRNIRKTDIPIDKDEHGYVNERDGHTWFDRGVADAFDGYHEEEFGVRPGYFDGLDDGVYYEVGEDDTIVPISVAYSTYGTLRALIEDYATEVVGDPEAFREMVHFSDCDGTIGPKVAAKLLGDFKGNRDGFFKFCDEELAGEDEGWFDATFAKGLYDGYIEALDFAVDGGAIIYG